MLYLIKSEDRKVGADKLLKLKEALLKKKPNAESFSIDSENFDPERLKELIYSSGLFENKYIVTLKNLLSDKNTREETLSLLREIKNSENIFIFLETDISKTISSRVGKNAEKVEEFKFKKEKVEEFNIFSLTDSLGERDRKKTWVLYQKALFSGKSTEEVHGILFWQLKNLILAKRIKNAGEASLNPFVFRQARKYSKNFSEEELQKKHFDLVNLYHEARRGIVDLNLSLESFLLKI